MVNEIIIITRENLDDVLSPIKLLLYKGYVLFPINLIMKGYVFTSLWKKKNNSQEKNKKKIKKLIYYYFYFAYLPRLLTFLASNFGLVIFAKNLYDFTDDDNLNKNFPFHLFRNITNIIFMVVFNIALLRRKEDLLKSFNIKIKDVLSFVLITLIPFTATKYVNENLI